MLKHLAFTHEPFVVKESYVLMFASAWDVSLILLSISNTLVEHYKQYQLGLKSKYCNITIAIQDGHQYKFKESDPETILERLLFLCNQFKRNEMHFRFGIGVVGDLQGYTSPEVASGFWPFARQWNGKSSTIMIRRQTPTRDSFGENYLNKSEPVTRDVDLSAWEEYAYQHHLDIIYFDYNDKFDYIVDNMITTKMVVSDHSGLAAMSLFTGTPFIMVTHKNIHNELTKTNRPVTIGHGHLTMNHQLFSLVGDQLVQGYFEPKVFNTTPDKFLIP